MSGVDYRGVPVLAAYRPVAGTDWFLIAKIDRDEALAPVRDLAKWVSLVAFFAVAAIGVAVLMLWRQQQRAHRLHLKAQASAVLRQSEARYRAATESAGMPSSVPMPPATSELESLCGMPVRHTGRKRSASR
ncbi:MAG: hypothetical protein M5R42_05160 [Rhodocyclaceae bacterium]|nr:hypothetical protein [Rhodocyclaceae bacterium]